MCRIDTGVDTLVLIVPTEVAADWRLVGVVCHTCVTGVSEWADTVRAFGRLDVWKLHFLGVLKLALVFNVILTMMRDDYDTTTMPAQLCQCQLCRTPTTQTPLLVATLFHPRQLTCIEVASTTYDPFARFKVGTFANHRNQRPISGTQCQACVRFMSSSVANDTTQSLTLSQVWVTHSAPSNTCIYLPILAPALMRTSPSPPGPINTMPLPCTFPI